MDLTEELALQVAGLRGDTAALAEEMETRLALDRIDAVLIARAMALVARIDAARAQVDAMNLDGAPAAVIARDMRALGGHSQTIADALTAQVARLRESLKPDLHLVPDA